MATLLDLTAQGDVATISDDAYLNRTLQLMTPQQLYELWERQQWQSQSIDLERDKEQWAALAEEQREEHLWGLSSFFVGEERVTTQFSGLVMAYEDEQEEAFLTTQQVDEARHMQFFDRYFREVMGLDHALIRDRLAFARKDVTDAFVELFDDHLVEAGRRLIADPRDMEAKVDFIVAYHMVIEGTLALTGQHFMLDYYEKQELLPGFQEGFTNIARDEHRHVAYGTWFLQQKCADPLMRERVQSTLNKLLPLAAGVLVPKGYSIGDDYEFFGYTSEEQAAFAYSALTRRLKVIGVGMTRLPHRLHEPVHAPPGVDERLARLEPATLEVADQDRMVVAREVLRAPAAQVDQRSRQLGHVLVPAPIEPGELVLGLPVGEAVGQLELVGTQHVHTEAPAGRERVVAARAVPDRDEHGGRMRAVGGQRRRGQPAGPAVRTPRGDHRHARGEVAHGLAKELFEGYVHCSKRGSPWPATSVCMQSSEGSAAGWSLR